ncbi:uncharacterized protein TNIN_146061 [Trichonephila inaurata madagascariensis]|uniref:Major facilitator superfamily (MFS) profile domain-containing protein n=1 Tax=Trichonephila inaurata madagascariensis TaxID=2747483 RepID=A0A8X7C4B2_9ARAC|nr:uncharacterized protein TNIN_146061 [Trichonephila inaurata madagascariensis]
MNGFGVLAVAFIINFLLMGMARLAPMLFVASIERYNSIRRDASLPFVLCYFSRTLSGPLTGYLGNKFGLRSITVFGCIASAFGIGLCFFAEDILAVTIFWGCLYGLGFGFGTSLLPAIVCFFKKI